MLRKFTRKKKPDISVIIATYNWSSALKLSLTSALQQTMKNIEVIVVGDCCTDDSEKVINSFRDGRIRWINLTKNSGCQSIPNMIGIQNASSDYIAYLGHDDIWHPTHLETLFGVARDAKANFVFSSTIFYGPPDTDIRMVTGFPMRDKSENIFHALPPTSIMHTKKLSEKIGGWRKHDELEHSVDYDFQLRAKKFEDAVFAHTGKITAFKFPAAWNRDSYKKKDVSQQINLLSKIQKDPNFLVNELIEVIKSADHNFFLPTNTPSPLTKGELFVINNLMKGTQEPQNNTKEAPEETIFTLEKEFYGFEWQILEKTESDLSFRWTGPRTESTLFIPISTKSSVRMEINILYTISQDVLDGLNIFVNDHLVKFQLQENLGKGWLLICDIPTHVVQSFKKDILKIKIKTPRTIAPIELNKGSDAKRRLGIAVHSVKCSLLGRMAQ